MTTYDCGGRGVQKSMCSCKGVQSSSHNFSALKYECVCMQGGICYATICALYHVDRFLSFKFAYLGKRQKKNKIKERPITFGTKWMTNLVPKSPL